MAGPDLTAQLPLAGRQHVMTEPVELLARLVPDFDRLGQPHLVVLGEQRILADIGQIEPDEVFFISFDSVFGQPSQPPLFAVRSAQCNNRPRPPPFPPRRSSRAISVTEIVQVASSARLAATQRGITVAPMPDETPRTIKLPLFCETAWDERLAQLLVQKTMLVGITYRGAGGAFIENRQFTGQVVEVDAERGICVRLSGSGQPLWQLRRRFGVRHRCLFLSPPDPAAQHRGRQSERAAEPARSGLLGS